MSNNDMTLFGEGGPLMNPEMSEKLAELNKKLTGGGSEGMRRISLKGSKFRELVGGEEVNVNKSGELDVVIINAADVSRMYYEGSYSADTASAPVCWSTDTKTPHPDSASPQAKMCKDCPQNVKGSGIGETRACKYQQRIAVVMEHDLETVWQLQLPATSVFGDVVDKKMPMQAYAKFLQAHKTPAIAIITRIYFDDDSDVPKVFFKPIRPLNEDELAKVMAASESEESERAVTITVAQADGVQPLPKPEVPETSGESDESDDEPEEPEEPEEPKKMTRRKGKSKKDEEAEEPKSSSKLGELVDGWDD